MMKDANMLYVEAEVRYWEDASVNEVEDTAGDLIPLRDGLLWKPTINLENGEILEWPKGTTASIHYKVCDQGEYWLLDSDGNKKYKWNGYYVPDDLLCVGESGYGDYIIFNVGADGLIKGWKRPSPNESGWTAE
jgi:hypothetical protein